MQIMLVIQKPEILVAIFFSYMVHLFLGPPVCSPQLQCPRPRLSSHACHELIGMELWKIVLLGSNQSTPPISLCWKLPLWLWSIPLHCSCWIEQLWFLHHFIWRCVDKDIATNSRPAGKCMYSPTGVRNFGSRICPCIQVDKLNCQNVTLNPGSARLYLC